MAINHVDLADLQGTIPIVDADGLPSPAFLRFLNTTVRALKAGVNNLIDIQNAAAAAQAAATAAQTAATAAQSSAVTAQATADTATALVATVDYRTTSARQFLALE